MKKYFNLKTILTICMCFVLMFSITGCGGSTDKTSKTKKETVTAKMGDRVGIDFDGYLDGKKFEGGSATNYYINLGSNTFIDNFEDQIVGHKVGETFDVNVTFPDTYSEESLRGKDVVFKVTLHEIWRNVASDLS